MADDRKTQADLNLAAQQLKQTLSDLVTGERDWLEKPYVAALMLHNSQHSLDMDSVLGAYFGVKANAAMPRYLQLEEALRAQGFVYGRDRYEIGNDIYVSAVEPRTTKNVEARAIILEGQERDFIVVFNREGALPWSLHIRQAWRDFGKDFEKGYCSAGFRSSELTPWDIVRMAGTAMRYSDDLPGVQYPSRPSMEAYVSSTLVVATDGSPNGLTYGDFRDHGYVVSMEVDYFTKLPEVKKGSRVQQGDFSQVTSHLQYAANCLVRAES